MKFIMSSIEILGFVNGESYTIRYAKQNKACRYLSALSQFLAFFDHFMRLLKALSSISRNAIGLRILLSS